MDETGLLAHIPSRNVRAAAERKQWVARAARHTRGNWFRPGRSAHRNCDRCWAGRRIVADCQTRSETMRSAHFAGYTDWDIVTAKSA